MAIECSQDSVKRIAKAGHLSPGGKIGRLLAGAANPTNQNQNQKIIIIGAGGTGVTSNLHVCQDLIRKLPSFSGTYADTTIPTYLGAW